MSCGFAGSCLPGEQHWTVMSHLSALTCHFLWEWHFRFPRWCLRYYVREKKLTYMACWQNHTASLLCAEASGSSSSSKEIFFIMKKPNVWTVWRAKTGPSPRSILVLQTIVLSVRCTVIELWWNLCLHQLNGWKAILLQ